MQLLLAVIITASLFWVSLLYSKQADPTDSSNMPTYVAQSVAEDLLFDLNIASQYAEESPKYEGRITIDKLAQYYKFYKDGKKNNLAEFTAYVFNESQTNARYVLITWDVINKKVMALETVESNTMGSILQILGQRPLNSYPVMVGVKDKANCELKIYSIIKESTIEEKYTNAFKNLCLSKDYAKDWVYIILKQMQ